MLRLCLSLAILLGATPVLAEPPPPAVPQVVRVHYIRTPGADACPDDQIFRDAVAAQVKGRDPFAPDAPLELVVTLARRAHGFEGSAELRDASGLRWTRPFSPTPSCMGLVEDLAFAVASKIDPRGPAPAAAHAPAPSFPGLPRSPPLTPINAPVPADEPATLVFRIGAGAWMGLATAPRPVFGASVDAGFRVSWFSLAVEGRWDPPAGANVADGVDVSTARLMGGLAPCAHHEWFFGCVVGELGQVRGTVTVAGGASPEQRAAFYAAAGARLGAEIEVATHLSFRAAMNLLGAIQRPRFRLDQQNQWESPAFAGGLGAGLVASF